MNAANCPNHNLHVSAWAGYGRVICPVCHQVYVKSPERVVKEAQEAKHD
jgi:uncharacterized Zn finger protein (UPF0148 family)